MSASLSAVIYGTIGSVLAILLQILYKEGQEAFRRRVLAAFWQFSNPSVTVIHPIYHDSAGNPLAENLARIEIVIALHQLTEFLRDLGVAYVMQTDAHEIPPNTDVVYVSSPKGNRQSRVLSQRIQLPFESVAAGQTFFYRDTSAGVDFISPADRALTRSDIALVARLKDPEQQRTLFLFWGVHIPGTAGAISFATRPKHLRTVRSFSKKHDLAFIVRTPFGEGMNVGEPELISPIRSCQ